MENDPIAAWTRVQFEFQNYTPIRRAIKISHDQISPPQISPPQISVKKLDTLVAAIGEKNPLVLVFADAHNPGGCVWAGAGMQEESLFRRTALFKHLTRDLYPLQDKEAIY